jgi:putative hydrolase of the HAD superfamily
MIKVAIFDLDNTLTDFKRMKENAVDAAVEAMIDAGLLFSPDAIKKKVYDVYETKGIEFQNVFDVVLEEMLGKVDYKIQAAGIVAYRRAREASLVLYPHVKVALIGLMKRGIRLAVISDAPRKEAWLRLCYLQLHHMFDLVLTFDDTKVFKPSPIPFRRVLHHFQIKPEQALMIGDWPERDITGAEQVGIITIFAKYGDTFGTKASGAHYDVNDVIEVLDIVDTINGSSSTTDNS